MYAFTVGRKICNVLSNYIMQCCAMSLIGAFLIIIVYIIDVTVQHSFALIKSISLFLMDMFQLVQINMFNFNFVGNKKI